MCKEVIIIGRRGCPYTEKALEKAKKEGYNYTFVEVSSMPSSDMGEPFHSVAREKEHRTYPCIFEVNYIGGFSDWR